MVLNLELELTFMIIKCKVSSLVALKNYQDQFYFLLASIL